MRRGAARCLSAITGSGTEGAHDTASGTRAIALLSNLGSRPRGPFGWRLGARLAPALETARSPVLVKARSRQPLELAVGDHPALLVEDAIVEREVGLHLLAREVAAPVRLRDRGCFGRVLDLGAAVPRSATAARSSPPQPARATTAARPTPQRKNPHSVASCIASWFTLRVVVSSVPQVPAPARLDAALWALIGVRAPQPRTRVSILETRSVL